MKKQFLTYLMALMFTVITYGQLGLNIGFNINERLQITQLYRN